MSKENSADRRRYRRVDTGYPVTLFCQGETYRVKATNLSIGGVFIATKLPLQAGALVHLRLNLPDRTFIQATAQVRFIQAEVGVGVRFPDQPHGGADGSKPTTTPEEIRPVLGCYRWDSEGLPIYDAGNIGTFVHELCHSYTNAIVDQHLDALAEGGNRLFPLVARRMSRMAYSTWQTVVYESFVRASVIRYLADVQGAAAAATESATQAKEGFTWVPDLAELLKTYAAARDRYPTLGNFIPEIAEFFRTKATAMEAEAAKREATAPKLVTMSPANGAVDVEPSTATLVLQFDRPMKRTGWSLVGSKENVPEVVGTPAWDTAGKILTATIRLVPGRTYRFSLNSERFTGFQAADGTPLAPVDVVFSVKGF
mgnify:CR=1 FL=1